MSHPIHEANENTPYGNLTRQEFHKKHNILHFQNLMINNQNKKIFTQSWKPADSSTALLKGFIGMVHGFSAESSWLFELNAIAIAKNGYLVCALDLQGHGYSYGSQGLIRNFRLLVSDCIHFFNSVRANYPKIPSFLYGESMGGAICTLICIEQTTQWNGLVLSGPMFEVSKKFKPIWPLEKLLPIATFFAPSWRISCTKPPSSSSYKEPWKNKLVTKSPNYPKNSRPPAITARQLLKVCKCIKKRCHELQVPMLVLHGEDDTICDPHAAKFVFELAASKDKTLKIFPGMWHQLIGEPNQSVQLVFDTMMAWIEVRADLAKES